MLQKLVTFPSHTLSWWWWTTKNNGNELLLSNIHLTATMLVILITMSWFAWTFINQSKKNNPRPPLPPGPHTLPLVGNLLSLDPEFHTYITTLAKTYGPILTLWLGQKLTIVVSSPAIAREMLKDHDTTFANRDVSVAAKQSAYGGGDVAWSHYGSEWRMLRKLAVRGMLSNTRLDSVYSLRRGEIRRTIGYIFRNRVGSPVNISDQMFLTLFNVVTNMLWGCSIEGEDRVSIGFDGIIRLLGKPNISDFYPGLARFDLQGIEKKMRGVMQRVDEIFDMMIDQRMKMNGKGGEKESKHFLQSLLELKDGGDEAKTPLTMAQVKAMLMDMVVGGTDTTINSVEAAMAEMMNKPQVMQKLQLELDTIVGKDHIIEESHIPKLPYLYAIMKETLRLHPILPLLIPHSPSETCTIGGYTIPKVKNLSRISMAERVFMFSIASLVHSFEWKLPEGEKLDLTESFGIVLKKKIPLVAIPFPRLSDPGLYE
ncbi:Cytochrome P450 76T24 [Camellia lanceoleosa]|uniref:Cytochrome P450 76T24 n=1 Tax=Camellia lanceoleosa TaxID=1840588 RepID=A0ACC0FLL2_9ERIC|nr:Cytochrome P450 76T24 [Camellia lanceoleosa]